MTGQDGLTVPRDNIFVGSVLKYPFRHIQGPRPSTFVLLSVPSEGLQLLPFPKRRGRRSKKLPLFSEAGSRPVGDALAHEWLRAHNVFGPHLSQLAVLLSPPSFSLRLFPSTVTTLPGTATRARICCFAISDLSCRIGDSLSREAHESPQKITDAIYDVTTGPRRRGYFLFSVRCTNHVRVVPKCFTKRMGRS